MHGLAGQVAQPAQRIVHPRIARVAHVQPQVVAKATIGREQHTRRGADAQGHGRVVQGQGIDRGRQFQPQKVATRWPGETCASREMALKVDPQIIFIPSDAYDQGTYKALTESQIYSDPALSGMNAVKNKKVFVIDARWIMSTSQFMVRAMEEMAADAYGYKPEA